MKDWMESHLVLLQDVPNEEALFCKIAKAAQDLGFEYCAYGMRMPLPLTNPKITTLNNYPVAWQALYRERGYLSQDPTVAHCRRSQVPQIWSDEVFTESPELWHEARVHGLRVGWAQSTFDMHGISGMLTLARSHSELTEAELKHKEAQMCWLVQTSHQAMVDLIAPRLGVQDDIGLTRREIDVLQWTADGKTSSEISDILAISANTVNFHIKNAIIKLRTSNKTAAVVKAAMLGLLS